MSEVQPSASVTATPNAPAAIDPKPAIAAQSAAVAAPAEPAVVAKIVPDRYEIKLPDGALLDPAHVEKVSAYAKEHKLSNDEAQRVLERDNAVLAEYFDANKKDGPEWTRRVNEWEGLALADKEIGGTPENLKASAELGKRVINKFFPESIVGWLNETGYGSHPDILKGFVKLGKMMADDQLVQPGNVPGNKKSVEDLFYGETKTS